MRILVTGGAGFIGGHLVEALSAAGNNVVILDNLRRGWLRRLSCEHVFIESDIRNRAAVTDAMEGVDTVFHLAAQSNVMGAVTDADYSFTTNVGGTYEVLRAAKEAGVRRVVFTSSREVYGDAEKLPVREDAPLEPKNAYGASKVAGEAYCRAFQGLGLEVNVLRLANVYGPGDKDRVIPIFLDNALSGKPLRINGGSQVIDFVWVGTVVKALQAAAFGPVLPGPVNVGSGKGTAIVELAERIRAVTGLGVPIEMAPARAVETTKFVADIALSIRLLGCVERNDPLAELPDTLVAA